MKNAVKALRNSTIFIFADGNEYALSPLMLGDYFDYREATRAANEQKDDLAFLRATSRAIAASLRVSHPDLEPEMINRSLLNFHNINEAFQKVIEVTGLGNAEPAPGTPAKK